MHIVCAVNLEAQCSYISANWIGPVPSEALYLRRQFLGFLLRCCKRIIIRSSIDWVPKCWNTKRTPDGSFWDIHERRLFNSSPFLMTPRRWVNNYIFLSDNLYNFNLELLGSRRWGRIRSWWGQRDQRRQCNCHREWRWGFFKFYSSSSSPSSENRQKGHAPGDESTEIRNERKSSFERLNTPLFRKICLTWPFWMTRLFCITWDLVMELCWSMWVSWAIKKNSI